MAKNLKKAKIHIVNLQLYLGQSYDLNERMSGQI